MKMKRSYLKDRRMGLKNENNSKGVFLQDNDLLEVRTLIIQVMAEDGDDGFSPETIKLGKKEDIDKLNIGLDNTEEVLNEFKFLTQSEGDAVDKGVEWNERSGSGEWGVGGAGAPEQGNLELGELEQLTINNENDLNYDQLTAPKVENKYFTAILNFSYFSLFIGSVP